MPVINPTPRWLILASTFVYSGLGCRDVEDVVNIYRRYADTNTNIHILVVDLISALMVILLVSRSISYYYDIRRLKCENISASISIDYYYYQYYRYYQNWR